MAQNHVSTPITHGCVCQMASCGITAVKTAEQLFFPVDSSLRAVVMDSTATLVFWLVTCTLR